MLAYSLMRIIKHFKFERGTKEMRKNVALFLVFVMLVSVMPVSVFGDDPVVNQQHQGVMPGATVGSGIHDAPVPSWELPVGVTLNDLFTSMVHPDNPALNSTGGRFDGGIGNYNTINDRTWASMISITIPFQALHGRSEPLTATNRLVGEPVGATHRTRLLISSRYAGVFANDIRNPDLVARGDAGQPVWSNSSRVNFFESVATGGFAVAAPNFSVPNTAGMQNGRFDGVRFLSGSTTGTVPGMPVFAPHVPATNLAISSVPVYIGGASATTSKTLNPNVTLGFELGNIFPMVQNGSLWGHPIVHAATAPAGSIRLLTSNNPQGIASDAEFAAWSRPLIVAESQRPNVPVYAQVASANDLTTSGTALRITGSDIAVMLPGLGAPQQGGFAGIAILSSQTGGGDSNAVVAIYTTEAIGAMHTGSITFTLPMRGQRENNNWQFSTLTVRTAPEVGAIQTIINQWRLAVTGVRNVSWSVTGGARSFTSALQVPSLRISESQFGTLNNASGGMHIRLEAPAFYSWAFTPAVGVNVTPDIVSAGSNTPLEIRAGGIANGHSFSNPAGQVPPTVTNVLPAVGGSEILLSYGNIWGTRTSPAGAAPNTVGLHRIYIPINDFARNTAWAPSTGWIELRNLWLVPDTSAQSTGDIHVGVQIGRLAQGWTVVAVPPGAMIPINATDLPAGQSPGTINTTSEVISALIPATTGTTGDIPFLTNVLHDGQRATLHVGTRTLATSLNVGTQIGNMPTGQGTPVVSFNITSTDIPAGVYYASISNLPAGVSMRIQSGNPYTSSTRAQVSIAANGTGRIQLEGSPATVAGTWNNLRLNLYNAGVQAGALQLFATSSPFTLSIGSGTTPPPSPTTPDGNDSSSSDDSGSNQQGQGNQGQGNQGQGNQGQNSQPNNIPANDGETSIPVNVNNNQVTLNLNTNLVNTLIAEAEETITFNMSDIENATTAVVPTNQWQRIADAGLDIELLLPDGTISFNNDALQSIADQARGGNISSTITTVDTTDLPEAQQAGVREGDYVFRIEVMAGNQRITEIDGMLAITVDFSGNPPVAAWRLNSDGTLEPLAATFQPGNATVTFYTNHLSIFTVGTYFPDDTPPTEVTPIAESGIGFTTLPAALTSATLRLTIGSTAYTQMGATMQGDAAPFIDPEYNRTMIPLRLVADGMGAQVSWGEMTRTVYISLGGINTSLVIDTPLPDGLGTPVIINDRTFVPARYVSEILGAQVRWDEAAQAVYIYQ